MKSSFNAFGRTRDEFGNLTIPVWLGKNVERVPVGGTLDRAYLKAGVLYQAGCPINLTNKVIKPFVVMQVTAVASGSVTVNVGGYGIVPETTDYIQKAAATLATAVKITKVAAGANAGEYVLTTAVADVAVGDAVVISPSSEGAVLPNAYLFNDIFIPKDFDVADELTSATGSAVMFNAAGILIDRTPAGLIKDIMKANVPGVYQHNE